MASVRESCTADSDGNGSMTPSEQSDNDERSEHDSDYESDDGEDQLDPKGKVINIQWTGYGKRVPIILFNAETILNKRTDYKTVGERYHLAFKFASTDCKIVRNILLSHGFHEVHPNSVEYNLVWSNSHLKPFTLRTMSEFQKINHFPRSYELTRKDRLFKNIQRMQQTKGHKHFDFIPPSFVLPGDYQEFCSNFLKDKGPYIVKPVASSRGRGVFLVNHPDQVPLDENVIVSKYISSPLVIDGFKFDVRIYVAVTSYDPLVIYLYEEGLTRFATVKYEKNIKHMRNQCMHLTNYSVNKRSQDYVKNDDPDVEDYGNKWSMGAMLRYLRSEGKDTAALMMRIEDVVIKTILSVESSIATACKMFQPFRGNCFELYGFDILLDETLKPWVLEVNLSPSLACDSPLDLKIKSNMLCDLFSLAGIICHDPLMRTRQQVSKQAAEIASKLKSRLKSAPVRPQSAKVGEIDDGSAELLGQIEAARLNMKDTDAWLLRRTTRPQSANSSASKDRLMNTAMAGLNSEEIKIIRRVKEEEARKGGWIRIFPAADSWETHGSFLQFPTTHNLMLHQRLYPERHKGICTSKAPGTSALIPSRSKNGIHLQITGSGKADQERFIESYTQALLRAKQYERRLGHVKKRHRRQASKKKSGKLAQGMAEMDDAELGSDEDIIVNERGKDKKEKDLKSEPKVPVEKQDTKTSAGSASSKQQSQISATKEPASTIEKEKEKCGEKCREAEVNLAKCAGEPNRISPLPSPISVPKYDVVALLEKGHTLSKVQARTAFAMYLIRVQQRLLSDCGSVLQQEDIDALNEQMDLVLRFLKRAAINLPQAFRVVVPSKKLPLSDRRRILAKQLGDFVHIYNKETDHLKAVKIRARMENKKVKKFDCSDGLDEIKFDQFVYTAVEGELEEVLTTYTKINKSAAIFLGGESKPVAGALTEGKREILSRRRENPDSIENSVHSGTMDETFRHRHETSPPSFNNNNNLGSPSAHDLCTGETHGVASWPGSAQHCNSSHSYLAAVSIYSQKLGRPRSASSSGISRAGHTSVTRPASAAVNRPVFQPPNSIFTTSDPIVDTYNEKAIQDALQRLALRQQARQYSSVNGNNILKLDAASIKASGMQPGTSGGPHHMPPAMSLTGHFVGQASAQAYSRPVSQGAGQPYVVMENHLAPFPPRHLSHSTMVPRPSHTGINLPKSLPTAQSSVHMLNTNAAFSSSFLEEPSTQWQNEMSSAFSEVMEVPPQNYYLASVNSRQFHLAQQQALKQSMMEQSKAMLEQSRAKHDALVTLAQNQQLSSSTMAPTYSHIEDMSQELAPFSKDHSHPTKNVMLKPPEHPVYKRPPCGPKVNRKTVVDKSNLNLNFNASLMATGQGSQS